MNFRSALLAAAACVGLLPATATLAASPMAPRAQLGPVPGEVIVKFKAQADTLRKNALAANAATADAQTVLSRRAATLGARAGLALTAGPAVGERTQVVRAAPGTSATALAARLAADPDVEYAVPNGRKQRSAAPNDPLYAAVASGVRPNGPDAGQWYLRAPADPVRSSINIEPAWARSTGAGVVVAVLDTGVRPEHPDLAGQLLPGYDFVSDVPTANDGDARDNDPSDPGDWITQAESTSGTFAGCTPEDSSWHGTSTSSLVAAATNNGVGMAGTAYGAKVLPLRVLGKCGGLDSDIVPAMRWAAGLHVDGVPDNPNPAKVISMSLGGDGGCTAAYQDAVNEIVARGITIVVAAGNSNGGPVMEPANCAGTIAVLALRHAGTKVGFSSLGPEVAIAAPGGNCINTSASAPCIYPILAATNSGTTAPATSTWSDSFNSTVGTSFTTPMVAGVVALMSAVRPDLSPATLKARMQATARPFPTSCVEANCNETSPPPVCKAPLSSVTQSQCFCTTTTCGAGMLDAGAAVQAVAAGVARIDVVTATPTAGSPVTLSAAGSIPSAGSSIVGYTWTVVNSGGIVSATFTSSEATATLTPTAAGSFTISVAVADGLGNTSLAQTTVTVAAAPVTGGGGGSSGGGGGGGAIPVWAAALLALAAAGLSLVRRR